MNWKPELDELARREAFAREMGGVDKVKRQHDQGRLTVRERIDRLIDKNSFHEVGAISGGPTTIVCADCGSLSAARDKAPLRRWMLLIGCGLSRPGALDPRRPHLSHHRKSPRIPLGQLLTQAAAIAKPESPSFRGRYGRARIRG